jgi:hypothetical protein
MAADFPPAAVAGPRVSHCAPSIHADLRVRVTLSPVSDAIGVAEKAGTLVSSRLGTLPGDVTGYYFISAKRRATSACGVWSSPKLRGISAQLPEDSERHNAAANEGCDRRGFGEDEPHPKRSERHFQGADQHGLPGGNIASA